MGTRQHRDHRHNGHSQIEQMAAMMPQGVAFNFQHLGAPLAQPVAAVIQGPGKVELIACGGLDHAAQLARDLFVRLGGEVSPEECLRTALAFWERIPPEIERIQAEKAAEAEAAKQPPAPVQEIVPGPDPETTGAEPSPIIIP